MATCKDCAVGSKRPAPYPGPRCATHWVAETKRRRQAAHERRVQQTYGLQPGDYEALLAHQGGVCWICERKPGRRKRLAVDHDHETGIVRGLLHSECNKMLGFIGRDDPRVFYRAARYLEDPPANHVFTTPRKVRDA